MKKGYQYAIEHPEEAADILIKQALKLWLNQRDFVLASQEISFSQYASDKRINGGSLTPGVRYFYAWAKKSKDWFQND